MNEKLITPSQALLESARLLRELHQLFLLGNDQGKQADAVREAMDAPWRAMTPDEQERIGGLSEDLYALAESGPPSVTMSDIEVQAWKKELAERRNRYLTGDIDGWLEFLRKPRPNNTPAPDGISRSVIHFFQAQCWENLEVFDVAAMFRKAAEKLAME